MYQLVRRGLGVFWWKKTWGKSYVGFLLKRCKKGVQHWFVVPCWNLLKLLTYLYVWLAWKSAVEGQGPSLGQQHHFTNSSCLGCSGIANQCRVIPTSIQLARDLAIWFSKVKNKTLELRRYCWELMMVRKKTVTSEISTYILYINKLEKSIQASFTETVSRDWEGVKLVW
jgi:hypothetical protein